MKLKHILIFSVGLLLGSCEADHRNDNLSESVVYLLNSNLQTADMYDVEETSDYIIRAFGSGFEVTPSTLRIINDPEVLSDYNQDNGTSYAELGADYYQMLSASASITADNPHAEFIVRLNVDKLKGLGDLSNYVIPLRLLSTQSPVNQELGTILVNPRMLETQVLVKNGGSVIECDLSQTTGFDLTTYVDFDNRWETQTEYAYGADILEAYNQAHGTSYLPLPEEALTFTPAQLEIGNKEAVSRIEIDRSKLTPDSFYTLAVQVTDNSMFKISEENTVLYHISLYPIFDDRSKWTLIACSSWYTGRGPELTTDGDVSTKFENRYNTIGEGDIETLPVTIDWNLGRECYYAGMRLTRRNDSYVTDLKAGWIEMSDDGKTWIPVQSFDFGSSKTVIGDFRTEEWLGAGRYLRLKMTESGRRGRKLVSVCEFEPVLVDAGN